MTERPNDASPDPLVNHREDLAAELLRAAHRKPSSRRFLPTLRRGLVLPLATLTLIGGAVGIASGLPSALISPEGHEMLPATEYRWPFSSNCPAKVRQDVWHLDQLSDYVETAGYPVDGCPTVDELQADERFMLLFEHRYEPGGFERFMRGQTN